MSKTVVAVLLTAIFTFAPVPSRTIPIMPTECGEPTLIASQSDDGSFFTPRAIVIHHSGSWPWDGYDNWDMWAGYRRYHMETVHPGVWPQEIGKLVAQEGYPDGLTWPDRLGRNDIDYHWGVGTNGEIIPGRDEREVGWHAGGRLPGKPEINTYALGVCFIGNFCETAPTEIQYQAGVKLVAELALKYKINFQEIWGHWEIRYLAGEGISTSCPGRYFPLEKFKEDVRMLIAGFYDISYQHWAFPSVLKLCQLGIVRGFENKTLHPSGMITRAEFIYSLWKIAGAPPSTYYPSDTIEHWARDAISWGYRYKFIAGYPDGTFRPDRPITRAETAKIVSGYLSRPPVPACSFVDVNIFHWAAGYIYSVRDLLQGYPDGTFRPDNQTTRAEAFVILGGLLP